MHSGSTARRTAKRHTGVKRRPHQQQRSSRLCGLHAAARRGCCLGSVPPLAASLGGSASSGGAHSTSPSGTKRVVACFPRRSTAQRSTAQPTAHFRASLARLTPTRCSDRVGTMASWQRTACPAAAHRKRPTIQAAVAQAHLGYKPLRATSLSRPITACIAAASIPRRALLRYARTTRSHHQWPNQRAPGYHHYQRLLSAILGTPVPTETPAGRPRAQGASARGHLAIARALAPTRLPFEPLLLPQRGCETKGRGGPADGLGSLGRRLRGLPEGRSRPERAQIGLVLASQTGAANEKRTSAPWRHMQPPHPSPPWDHAAYKCRVQCGAAAGRCSRAEWRRRRRSRQAGLRVARFSYPFSRQRDASSQPAALGQPCRSALASHRHCEREARRCLPPPGAIRAARTSAPAAAGSA